MQAYRDEMHDDPLVFAVKDNLFANAGVLYAGAGR